jgi:hypothetical protein
MDCACDKPGRQGRGKCRTLPTEEIAAVALVAAVKLMMVMIGMMAMAASSALLATRRHMD